MEKDIDLLLSIVSMHTTLTIDALVKVLAKDSSSPEDFLDAVLKTADDVSGSISFFIRHREEFEKEEMSVREMLFKAHQMNKVNDTFVSMIRKSAELNAEHEHDCDNCPLKGECDIEDQMRVLKMQKPNINSEALDAEIKESFLNQITKLKTQKQ